MSGALFCNIFVTAQSSRVLPFSNHRSIIYSNELHRSKEE